MNYEDSIPQWDENDTPNNDLNTQEYVATYRGKDND